MATILDLVIKHNALTQEEILYFQQQRCTFIENLLMNVNKYPKLYDVLKEYYQNTPKEINNIGTDGATPLMFATLYKETTKLLLSCGNGATINYQDKDGYTALHYATIRNNIESGKLLCEYGAGVHIKNIYGMASIDKAIRYDYGQFAQLLLEYDSNTTNKKYKDLVNNISLLNVLS